MKRHSQQSKGFAMNWSAKLGMVKAHMNFIYAIALNFCPMMTQRPVPQKAPMKLSAQNNPQETDNAYSFEAEAFLDSLIPNIDFSRNDRITRSLVFGK